MARDLSNQGSKLINNCKVTSGICPTTWSPVTVIGAAFLSKIMFELYKLLGIKKVSTTAYHPQTDGLVEWYICTLVDMLSKKEQSGKDWDKQLPYVLFAWRTSFQESTKASPFFLSYGRDLKLPTTAALNPPVDRVTLKLADYQTKVAIRMSNAWESAKAAIKRAQKQQKLSMINEQKTSRYLWEILCLCISQQRNLEELTNSQGSSKVLIL